MRWVSRLHTPLWGFRTLHNQSTNLCRSYSSRIERLNFTNGFLKHLPIEAESRNFPRQVAGCCFSPAQPTPVSEPSLVAYSADALALIDLQSQDTQHPGFTQYVSGNQHVPGSNTVSHCYCGHQYGLFSGQLGDGAAM